MYIKETGSLNDNENCILLYTCRFSFTGGDIGSVICTAAEIIAGGNTANIQSPSSVTTELLEQVAEAHLTKMNQSMGHSIQSMFQ